MYSEICDFFKDDNIDLPNSEILLNENEKSLLRDIKTRDNIVKNLTNDHINLGILQDKLYNIDQRLNIISKNKIVKKDNKKYEKKKQELSFLIEEIDSQIIYIRNKPMNAAEYYNCAFDYYNNHYYNCYKEELHVNIRKAMKFRYISPKITIQVLNPSIKYALIINSAFVIALINLNIDPMMLIADGTATLIGMPIINKICNRNGEKYKDLNWLIKTRKKAKDKLNRLALKNIGINEKQLPDNFEEILNQRQEINEEIAELQYKIKINEQAKEKLDNIIEVEINSLDENSKLKTAINNLDFSNKKSEKENSEEKKDSNQNENKSRRRHL